MAGGSWSTASLMAIGFAWGRTTWRSCSKKRPRRCPVLMDTTSDVRNLGQMAAILNGLRALGSGRVLAEVLAVVLDAALDVTKAERGFIMLANERGELEFKTARGVGGATLPGSSFATSRQIPREVFSTDRAQLLTDLTEAAGGHDSARAVGIRHVMCVPLRVAARAAEASSESAHRVLGVLYLDGQARSTMRSSAVLSALEAFATQAALAIESARLYAEAAEKARVDRDLCLAAEIQRSLLGAPAFSGERFDLAAAAIHAERSAAISTTIWSWPMAAWRSPWATSPERARRRRSWRRWFRATSSHKPQSAPTPDRPRLASTTRCCVARSRHALPRCSTACSPGTDV